MSSSSSSSRCQLLQRLGRATYARECRAKTRGSIFISTHFATAYIADIRSTFEREVDKRNDFNRRSAANPFDDVSGSEAHAALERGYTRGRTLGPVARGGNQPSATSPPPAVPITHKRPIHLVRAPQRVK
jgi:hypothetical protein